jgi:hypothetical protein
MQYFNWGSAKGNPTEDINIFKKVHNAVVTKPL